MTCRLNIEADVGFSFYVNQFTPHLWLLPALGGKVLAGVVKLLDVGVFHRRTNVCESPRDPLIVPDNHVRIAREAYSRDVKAGASQMRLIPQIRHLMSEVHVVREQRLA